MPTKTGYDSSGDLADDRAAAEASHAAVLARVKHAVLQDDRSGALALHILLSDDPETAVTLTPVLAQAPIATARKRTRRRGPACAPLVR